MSRALKPIEVLAYDCCSDLGDSNFKFKAKFDRHLLNCYTDLKTFLTPETEVRTEILSFSNVINLPTDLMYVTKVGVRRNGRIAILTLSNEVQRELLNDTACCDYLNSVWDGSYAGYGYAFYNSYWNGNYYGELYGMGRAIINNSTYSINKKEGAIYLGSNIPTDAEIIIEYVSSGLATGVTLVPLELQRLLKYGAKRDFYEDRNPALSEQNEVRYKKEYNKMKRYYNHMTPLSIALAVNEVISPANY